MFLLKPVQAIGRALAIPHCSTRIYAASTHSPSHDSTAQTRNDLPWVIGAKHSATSHNHVCSTRCRMLNRLERQSAIHLDVKSREVAA
jgi:hypothetical protein